MKWIKTLALLATGLLLAPLAPAQVAGKENAIEGLQVARQGNEIAVRIDLREPLAELPASFAIAAPAKIALDFPLTVNALGKNNQLINEGDLRSVNVVQVGERTRMVLNLIQKMNYKTRLEGRALYLTLSPLNSMADSAAVKNTRFTEERLFAGRHTIRDLIFRRGKDGEGRVLIELSDAGAGIDIRQQGSNLVVDFAKTSLPEHLQRKLDVADFATPVMSVESRVNGDNVRLIISPKGLWEHNAYQSDNQFVIEVRRLQEDPNKLVQGSTVGYQGPRVSINYQNGDVRALLRLMAEELGLNAVVSETVTGNTTLVLKDVPADQVIDIIFQQKGLDMRKKGNIVMIAPRDEIATREKLDFEAKQQISELEPVKMEQFVLNYQKAPDVAHLLSGVPPASAAGGGGESGGAAPGGAGSAQAMSQRILSKRGSAVADPQSNLLFVNDIPSKLEEIRAFIKAIDVGARQVMIEARVVEAHDAFNKELGVRLGLINSRPVRVAGTGSAYISGGQMRPEVTGTGATPGTPATLTQTPMVGVNLPMKVENTGRVGSFALSLFNASVTRILNLELAALESDGGGKIISSPRVVTANNVKAKIEDGTEVPYVTTQVSGGAVTRTIRFKPAKLSLEATPQITPEGTVRMALIVKKEEPDWTRSVEGNPPIKSSIVETNVVVENGGTVVIGGVFITNNEAKTDKVPFLGDLPFLGWAFKYKYDKGERRELLVFITPRIISDKMQVD